MFAPWCPTCDRRMLLGPRRVEHIERGPHGPRVVLRCFCGTALVWSPASDASPGAGAQVQAVPTASSTAAPSGETTVMVGSVKLDR